MARTPSGAGCWLLGQDGGVFTFGNAPFFESGSAATPLGTAPTNPQGVAYSGIVTLIDGAYALAISNGIGYAAFDANSYGGTDQQAFGAMLGPPAHPLVGISA